ncbi:hypothetical protein [Collimonas fungivorans]|uniref:hypothetical protein n=1 Tax=Collimonas fungivorans TaxID=158899 RepID=UPI003FA360CE
MTQQADIDDLVKANGWRNVPTSVISREGVTINLDEDRWTLPITNRAGSRLNFSKIKNRILRWALKTYVIHRIERVSTAAGSKAYESVWRCFLRRQVDFDIAEGPEFRLNFISLIEAVIWKARRDHKLYQIYEAIRWYLWSAENYPELGFCPIYALELDSMTIPGGPKGEAVRMLDPECGPLHRSLELPLIIDALRSDTSTAFVDVQQRAAVALSLALGRNPMNLTYLRDTDFEDLTPGSTERCYVIHMPRIKKRQLSPRDDRRAEYLAPEFARHIIALKSRNAQIETSAEINGEKIHVPRPLFVSPRINSVALETGQLMALFNVTSDYITSLIKSFVTRHNIISPITGEPLEITVRRLRYTLATNLAAEGIGKRELARILDHSDTQHVQVYFDVASNIVEHLDKAAAKSFSKYVSFFKGKIITESDATEHSEKYLSFYDDINNSDDTEIGICGQSKLCHLDPPYSCYLCPKFQPFKHADHEHVLECLLSNRNQLINDYEKARLGIQLDDVIAAVAEVVKLCDSGVHNE